MMDPWWVSEVTGSWGHSDPESVVLEIKDSCHQSTTVEHSHASGTVPALEERGSKTRPSLLTPQGPEERREVLVK